jgi:wyosine [tRNA(Phe)-imidazoG37] synthetase (radical SAM superfamily)
MVDIAAAGEKSAMRSVIYGPVPSWRMGRSLGIDLLSTRGKTCSFDCIYCQLGKTKNPLAERKEFVSIEELNKALESVRGIEADYVTFSGMGEPTLASNLGEAIELTRATINLPIAVLTNSSLMPRDDVCYELAQADMVVAKIDAPTEELFHKINRPCVKCAFDNILQAIKAFREHYHGKLALQIMFIEMNIGYAAEIAKLAKELSTDEIQINTPLRPCPVKALSPEEIADIRSQFTGLSSVVTVYEAKRPDVAPLDLEATLLRRPRL